MHPSSTYINDIKKIVATARQQTYKAVNSVIVEAYWHIGQRIVEEEQQGQGRADYGKAVIKNLSLELTEEFGKGFSERSVRNFRQFYLMFADIEIWQSVIAKLTWTHIQRILRVQNEQARHYYLTEDAENSWSVRTLDRNISTLYYDRLIASSDQSAVEAEMQQKIEVLQAKDFIKNPTVLDFLDLPSNQAYTETDGVVAKYSVLSDNTQLFASKYMNYLPTEEELIREIERQQLLFEQEYQ